MTQTTLVETQSDVQVVFVANVGTPVTEEVPTGSGTSFSLAHTPIAGTLKLYRGGARQQATVDFTLSGASITLTIALQAGEVLIADYGY